MQQILDKKRDRSGVQRKGRPTMVKGSETQEGKYEGKNYRGGRG